MILLLLLFATAAQAATIHTDFEGGRMGRVEEVAKDHFRLHVIGQTDQAGRNRQASWYYFRADGARGRTLTFDLVDLAGEYNYQPNRGAITRDTPPYISFDQKSWQAIDDAQYDETGPSMRFRVSLGTKQDRVWIAHVPPYTNANLQVLLRDVSRLPYVRVESLGQTPQKRDIPLLTIGEGKKVIWLMFRQHAWEAGSSWTGEGAIRFLTSNEPEAVAIRKGVIVKIMPMCDPDGVANGGVRFNAAGYDLNRNWDIDDPAKMPEIAAQKKAIYGWLDAGNRIDAFVTVHNTETNEYLAGPPDRTKKTRPLLERFHEYWMAGKTFAPSSPEPRVEPETTTSGMAGRMNVVQGLYAARQVPGFLIEMRIAKHPKLGGARPNIADRMLAGREMVTALWKALND
ncbi:hypothetical protein F183_A41400 [Bryobacterales bacterium F-183]|nr:hypothetical protein F183_A41400 [Bryobacterales bacterium F-183]